MQFPQQYPGKMLYTHFHSFASLHAVPVARIREMEACQLPTEPIRCVIRELDVSNLKKEELLQLNDLIDGYNKDLAFLMEELHKRANRRFCHSQRFTEWRMQLRREHKKAHALLTPDQQKTHLLSKGGVQGKVWKTALEDACSSMERYWRAIQVAVHDELRDKAFYSKLNDAEKYYVACLLSKAGSTFFDMLDGKSPKLTLPKKLKGKVADRRNLCRKVRATVRAHSRRLPRHGIDRSCSLTTECYSVQRDSEGNQTLKVITKKPRSRLSIPVKGKGLIDKTIKIIRDGGRFFLHIPLKTHVVPLKNIPAAPPAAGKPTLHCTALDMGYTEVFTDDAGHFYGADLGKTQNAIGRKMDALYRERNKWHARYRNATDCKTKLNIRRFNLGRKKLEAFERRARATLDCLVNRAINEIMERRPSSVYLIERFGRQFNFDGLSKRTKRKLSSWIRGTIEERFLFKASVHGAKVVYVPASYSSRRCPVCGYVHKSNRNDDSFVCKDCGHRAQSDANGAVNLLLAAHDKDITKFMTKESVKTVYRKEYEKECKRRGATPKEA